jgi:hypothetical protein
MLRTKLLVACTLVASLALFVGPAAAANPPITTAADVYAVDYFANANTVGAPDATVRIVHPGVLAGNLCADIYVFDTNEELSECCSCTVTPDGILTLSVNSDLTSNPLTGVVLTAGVIKIVSGATSGGLCPLPTAPIPTPDLRTWSTHIQNGAFTITENASQPAPLSIAEGKALAAQCSDIKGAGSGHGVCANSAALAAICNN